MKVTESKPAMTQEKQQTAYHVKTIQKIISIYFADIARERVTVYVWYVKFKQSYILYKLYVHSNLPPILGLLYHISQ